MSAHSAAIWFVRIVSGLVETADVVILFTLVVLLPLGLFRRFRAFAGIALLYLSFIVGAAAWLAGLAESLVVMGWWSLLGLLVVGLGCMPLGVIADIYAKDYSAAWVLVTLIVCTFAMRLGGAALLAKSVKD